MQNPTRSTIVQKRLFRRNDGKICAQSSQGVLRKRVSARRHLFRAMNAWALDCSIFEAAEKYGATIVEVFDKDSALIYRVGFSDMRSHGVVRNFGSGSQIFLPLKFWQVSDARQPELFEFSR